MLRKLKFCLVLVLACGLQKEVVASEILTVCDYSGCEKITFQDGELDPISSFDTSEIWGLVKDITKVLNVPANYKLISSLRVGNAAATTRGGERLILYNPQWISQFNNNRDKKWQYYGLMAHEIGHHLFDHNGSIPSNELEADELAGETLFMLGASLQQAQSLWRASGGVGSATHPPQDMRLGAVERGWNKATANSSAIQNTANSSSASSQIAKRTNSNSYGELFSKRGNCGRKTTSGVKTRVCVSSYIKDGGEMLDARQLFDGDYQTAWLGENAYYDDFDFLTFEFDDPVDIEGIQLYLGRPDDTWYSIPAEIDLVGSNGITTTLAFANRTGERKIDLSSIQFDNLEWLQVIVTKQFRGEKYDLMAISELRLN